LKKKVETSIINSSISNDDTSNGEMNESLSYGDSLVSSVSSPSFFNEDNIKPLPLDKIRIKEHKRSPSLSSSLDVPRTPSSDDNSNEELSLSAKTNDILREIQEIILFTKEEILKKDEKEQNISINNIKNENEIKIENKNTDLTNEDKLKQAKKMLLLTFPK